MMIMHDTRNRRNNAAIRCISEMALKIRDCNSTVILHGNGGQLYPRFTALLSGFPLMRHNLLTGLYASWYLARRDCSEGFVNADQT